MIGELFEDEDDLVVIVGLDEVAASAKLQGEGFVGFKSRARKDINGELRVAGGRKPRKDVEAVEFGHLQIEEDESRHGKTVPIREAVRAPEVIYGRLTVVDELKGMREGGLFEGALEKETVVGIIFGDEDGACVVCNGI